MTASQLRTNLAYLVLNFIAPGAAQIRTGRLRTGILLGVSYAILGTLVLAIGNTTQGSWFSALVMIATHIPLVIVGIALVTVIPLSRYENLRPTSWWTVGVFFLALHLTGAGVRQWARVQVGQVFQVSAASMEPTILAGEMVFAQIAHQFERGELVLYQDERGQTFVKRVIGLEGDRIRLQGKTLMVNERVVPRTPVPNESTGYESYRESIEDTSYTIRFAKNPPPGIRRDRELTVPTGNVYLLGDNRDESFDSRLKGPVATDRLRGIARMIWFSKEKRGSIRWSRIGKRLNQSS